MANSVMRDGASVPSPSRLPLKLPRTAPSKKGSLGTPREVSMDKESPIPGGTSSIRSIKCLSFGWQLKSPKGGGRRKSRRSGCCPAKQLVNIPRINDQRLVVSSDKQESQWNGPEEAKTLSIVVPWAVVLLAHENKQHCKTTRGSKQVSSQRQDTEDGGCQRRCRNDEEQE